MKTAPEGHIKDVARTDLHGNAINVSLARLRLPATTTIILTVPLFHLWAMGVALFGMTTYV